MRAVVTRARIDGDALGSTGRVYRRGDFVKALSRCYASRDDDTRRWWRGGATGDPAMSDEPLIPSADAAREGADEAPAGWRSHVLAWGLIVGLTLFVFWPTLRNGFLQQGFDDAIVTDSEAIRGLTWGHLRAMATEFNHAHYVPLTMLSLAIDHHFWGLDPRGYHLTNVLLHALGAGLAYVFLCGVLRRRAALLAALIFAVHPLQMEAVSVAIQRKTSLSGALFFLTLILYQRWKRSDGSGWYAAALCAFALAALAKPMVVTLPLVLALCDYAFIDGRPHWRDKLPFLVLVLPVVAATIAAHAAVGAINPPHGGSIVTHVLMMSRVALENITALLLPLNLSTIYYYPRADAYAPLNVAALASIALAGVYLVARRRRHPWSFFCVAWIALVLAPESNIVPLAQLRADRFLYLSVAGFGIWLAVVVERVYAAAPRWRRAVAVLAILLIGTLASLTRASASIWHDDVTAWTRAVERNPWCGLAYHMLGVAEFDAGRPLRAGVAFERALSLNPQLVETHLSLARLYLRLGRPSEAATEIDRFLRLSPGNTEGLAVQGEIEKMIRPPSRQ